MGPQCMNHSQLMRVGVHAFQAKKQIALYVQRNERQQEASFPLKYQHL